MDRTLNESISDRQRKNNRGDRYRRQDGWLRDDSRKMNGRSNSVNIDIDWIHDKYEDDPQSRRPNRNPRNPRIDRYFPATNTVPSGAKLRVENLHYDLTEDDLEGLFNRIGPISTLALRFDRAGRSSGTAFVTYISLADARAAIREFDGANANGQPIRLTLLSAPGTSIDNVRGQGSGVERARNPFDTAVKPGRSLFERVEDPDDRRRYAMDKGRSRSRSRSPGAPRRTNTSKPPPEGVDRYVPSPSDRFDGSGRRRARTSRSHSPRWRAGARDDSRRRRPNGGGRERKTQEDLDKEMDDYFKEASGNKASAENSTNGVAIDSRLPTAAATNGDKDGDIDMIE